MAASTFLILGILCSCLCIHSGTHHLSLVCGMAHKYFHKITLAHDLLMVVSESFCEPYKWQNICPWMLRVMLKLKSVRLDWKMPSLACAWCWGETMANTQAAPLFQLHGKLYLLSEHVEHRCMNYLKYFHDESVLEQIVAEMNQYAEYCHKDHSRISQHYRILIIYRPLFSCFKPLNCILDLLPTILNLPFVVWSISLLWVF